MGAWGAGPFDNDDASDWVWELDEDTSGAAIRHALDLQGVEIDASEAANAVAAGELVAVARGQGSDVELPEEASNWISRYGHLIGPDDVSLALRAMQKICSDSSELKELWDESEDESWKAAVSDLQRRLGLAL